MDEDDQRLKEGAALASIAVSSVMTAAKFVAGISSGSLAVLSEAAHNFADVGATILTYFAIKIAHKPADDDHQYGHAKVETLAALIETGFLFALSAFILVEALRRLGRPHEIEAGYLVFGILAASITVDFARWQRLRFIARKTKSEALAADALHFSSDMVASFMAIAGLVAAHFGFLQGDALAALGVAGFVALAGYNIGRRTIGALIDAAPKGLADQVASITASVPGVIEVEAVRLRPAGPEVIGDLEITVPRTLSLEKVAAIKDNVAAGIRAKHPDVSVTIATQPIAIDSETILERILLIAARRHAPVHHVTVQTVDGRIAISFDVEMDGHMSLGSAHEIASGLEDEIGREFGSDVEVDSHIEPMEPGQLAGRDADAGVRAEIENALTARACDQGALSDIHNVRVRETTAGLIVNYHLRVDPTLSVNEVHHEVDALEHKIRAAFKTITRIVGHAEPAR